MVNSATKDFFGPNLGYVVELYDKYLENPQSVDEDMRSYFQKWGSPIKKSEVNAHSKASPQQLEKVVSAIKLANKIRAYGHQAANIYPLHDHKPEFELFELEKYDLSKEDLLLIPAEIICPTTPEHVTNGLEAIEYLKTVYTKTIAFEFLHVNDVDEKNWLQNIVESGSLLTSFSTEKKIKLLKRLTEIENFELFLHKTFVGQKRFSIEGLETLVPLLDEVISESVKNGAKTINIGMAHRGRLNVLAHVLEKPYEMIFAEFQHAPNKELVPSEGSIGINFGWTGDVKYHLGLDRQLNGESTKKVRITLANNPSHLEFVGSVVEGFTRAAQDDRSQAGYPNEDQKTALAILIHGDAAFPGQGVVAETLNLSRLIGYRTGGTIHVIANNSIGFTTESYDSRSTRYASDLAKGFEIPILHVNADDPEACIKAAELAYEYRAKFNKDFLIDLIGYRRFGHNEMDEPMTTNPLMYSIIHQHPTVKTLYSEKLQEEGITTEAFIANVEHSVYQKLQAAYEKVDHKTKDAYVNNPPLIVEHGITSVDTSVPLPELIKLNDELLAWPDRFNIFPKLAKILNRRKKAFDQNGTIDWGLAETLAFGTILKDGTPIRLSGQDSERGTFAQRNIILHDIKTGEAFSPLHQLSNVNVSFAVHNSPLSECSVLGFEYGYNVFAPETLVIWEAQYGDFANAAQIMFDQFIAAGRAKWGQKSGLVMLLPHGYEGQGPEHSSGRVERFLILAAENNWTVANLTTAAQYFHILRRQAAILTKEEVRPLVIMTPKSLLRNPLVSSTGKELSEEKFKLVLEHQGLGKEYNRVERIILCSGKIAIDLQEKLEQINDYSWLHILRIEQIYPFPLDKITEIFNRYPNVKEIVWVQEEPKNMGVWNFVEPRLKYLAPKGAEVSYIGRRRRSSPAEGDPLVHKKDQLRIVREALTRSK
ncbi:2-oxoglutarate dehydrogenase E1 component [Bacillus sp. 03113]|uniref:2-oxoglutarate dehydrogenase E1 component n=1 Tax=Bacillus sp. 03113 TaxID=2578211 RepID=UPI00114260C7|nr:2-oxoglutarate dehydrogenase E1 component [Bacillus sp. 03113]